MSRRIYTGSRYARVVPMSDIRKAVSSALANFRKQGYLALQNTDGDIYKVTKRCKDAEEKGKPYKGYVFSEKWEWRAKNNTLVTYFSYGATNSDGEKATVAVAKKLVAALTEAGLTVEWNGTQYDCVTVVTENWEEKY